MSEVYANITHTTHNTRTHTLRISITYSKHLTQTSDKPKNVCEPPSGADRAMNTMQIR